MIILSDEYQLRKDIDFINQFAYELEDNQLGLVYRDNLIADFNNAILNDPTLKLDNYYDISEVDSLIESIEGGGSPIGDYVTETELQTALASYTTIEYANTNYSDIEHTHPNYVDRSELSDLDIDLSTLDLVPYSENPNGVMCFQRISGGEIDWNDIVNKPSSFTPSLHNHDERYYTETETDNLLSLKQNTLISGTNIKTVNNQSLLGSGNITIQGGGGSVIGTGSFSIDNNGHLIVELPNGVDNPYFIDNNGHLIYDTSNTYNGS